MLKSQSSQNAQRSSSIFSNPQTANDGAPLVLIVEDDADGRFMLRYMLEMWKYRVAEAANGADAVKVAARCKPDLILMDVSLPDSTGFAVARDIRGCADLSRVPVVFLSGYARSAFGEETGEAGEYFLKPICADELKKTVSRHCGEAADADIVV